MGAQIDEGTMRGPMCTWATNRTVDPEDDHLARAGLEVEKSGSILPILKHELKLKILTKRHILGQENIKVDFSVKPSQPLTQEEIEKQDRRKASNRKSAQRCREKRKAEVQTYEGEFDEERKKRKLKQAVIKRLSDRKDVLIQKLRQLGVSDDIIRNALYSVAYPTAPMTEGTPKYGIGTRDVAEHGIIEEALVPDVGSMIEMETSSELTTKLQCTSEDQFCTDLSFENCLLDAYESRSCGDNSLSDISPSLCTPCLSNTYTSGDVSEEINQAISGIPIFQSLNIANIDMFDEL